MEGVPKLYMLRTALKTSPEKTDFSRKIKWQIREHFNEDPSSYANETGELETLRAAACHPPQDFTGCALLKKYYCQLNFLQNRFTFNEAGRDEVYFTWNDMYTGMAYSTTDIKHEMACVLFNIGALHMNLGAMDSRQTADGMKMSCSHFQCAAWAFQQLNEKYPQPRETDLCHELVKFLSTVSLAQAQECILEKSIIDGRKPGIVAKVAAQIVEYYKLAVKVLDQGDNHPDGNALVEVAGVKAYNTWKKYAEFKMAFHQCVALLYMGIHSEEMQKMGERLAYFQAAMDKLAEATKKAKKLENKTESVNDTISFVHDVVGGKLKAAEKENEFVYHEKVPDRASLPDIKGASLVKGTPFDIQDPEIAGQDIFHRLVPMEAHEASSLYSEEKAKLLRRVGGNVEEKDQELDLFLTSLQVDQLRVHLEPSGLPQELVDICARFSVESKDVVQSLIEAMGELSSVYTDVESSLAEVQNLLSEEQENERIYHGQGKRPPSMILKELSLEAGRFAEAHGKAADSNNLLHKAINSHLGNLRMLNLPLSEIEAQLPNIRVLESSKDQAAINELHRLLDKVEEMRKQRQMLYSQLREALKADDITKLATHQVDLETLFTQELAKHQRLTSLIDQNLKAQEKILVALTEANARYADTRRSTADIQQRRAATVSALLSSAEAYPDLLAKCQKGLEFYRKMDTSITKLLQRLRSVCRVQQEEREQQEAARERNRPVPVTSNRTETHEPADVQGGPKLKDFLHLMKKDRSGMDPAFQPTSSAPPPGSAGAEMAAPFSYPYLRPTPLGAEQSERHPQSSAYIPDGNSYYYQNNSSQGGFPPSGPSYDFPTTERALPTNATQPSASSQANSAYYSTPPALQQQRSDPISSTSQPQQPLHLPAAGQTYLGQQPNGVEGGLPPLGSNANHQMHRQNYPPSSNYYGHISGAGLSTPYAASAPSTPQQSYSAASQIGQQPIAMMSGSTATSSSSAVQNYPTTSYMPASGAPPTYQQLPSSAATGSFTPTITSATPHQQTYGAPTYLNQPSTGRDNVPAATPYSNTSVGLSPTHQQQQYPYYSGASMYGYAPTTTTNSGVYSYQYSYSTLNSNMDGSGGFQHGTTGTNNSALAQSAGHQGEGAFTASASGMGQYQHYPYYPNPVDPTNNYQYQLPGSYYQPNVYAPVANQMLQPAPLAPTPVSAAPAVAAPPPVAIPANPNAVGQVASNLELLTLLDLSVPMAPVGGLLEPQPRETQGPGGNTQGTTTLTNATSKSVMMAPAATSDQVKLTTISSATEFLPHHEAPVVKTEIKLPSVPNVSHKDPLADAELASKLAVEVEKLDKLVGGLTRKSLNGPTSLDTRWKEVLDLQERESARHSISVARCYPMKNRFPDVLPYDHNRVELPTTKDDYINASLVPSLSPGAPSFIATQTPLPCSQQDFWTMIWQQSVEIVVCLLSDAEIPKPSPSTSAVYWPVEKGRDITSGPWTITLQSSNTRPYCHERILGLIKNGEAKQRVVVHLQFTAWPGSSFPASPAQFLQLTSEVLHFWQQQRSKAHPIVVHCLAGAGRTGLFCLLLTALSDLSSGNGLLDVVRVAASLCQHRRNMFRDREHLLFAYQALLYHAQDLLMKRGILSGTTSLQGSPIKKLHPSQDFIHSPTSTSATNPTPVLEAAAEMLKQENKEEVSSQVIQEPTASSSPPPVTDPPTPKKNPLGALAILDPANFTLDGGQTNRHRVTKESFKNASQLGSMADPSDPLSQLDPLWSLAK
ncbi:tyrosine-protein phosphatase non-receptor type 23-like [Daphnia carinata]|uniref:tyrosine-protein phosphatase non-receptor type 23-like n=1 Tax=Daphnia carinata TaxID=120202 RepID=UPI00257F7ABB|nr:tyrosine-protein phosphatase non-receptor type 23-like [Daphnia carinata]